MMDRSLQTESHTSRNEIRKSRNESKIYRNDVILSESPKSNPGHLCRNSERDKKVDYNQEILYLSNESILPLNEESLQREMAGIASMKGKDPRCLELALFLQKACIC